MRLIFQISVLLACLTVFGQNNEENKAIKKKKNRQDTSRVLAQPARLEIPIADMRDDFQVVDGYEEGLLVIHNTNDDISSGELWKLYLVNKDLHVEWELNQVLDSRAQLKAYDYSIGFYFFLFEMPGRLNEYKAMVIDVKGEKVLIHDFQAPFEMELQFFEALDNGILMVGQHNFRPVALIHDLVGNKPKILPGFYNHNEYVFDVVIDEKNRAFSIVLAEKMINGKYTNRIKTFTYDGLLVVENLIHPGEDLNLIDGTTTSFGSGIQYMVGTYSIQTSNYSRGIYISKFVHGQQRFIQEHNYGDLNNFFMYKGEKAAKRIQRRVDRKKEKGKKPRFNYKLFIHRIIPKGDLNIIVAEAYYPRYSNTTPTTGNMGGFYQQSLYMSSTGNPYDFRNFLGYKFTHAIIVAFDSKGNIVWDNSFRTNDITNYNLEESVAANIQGDKAVISYLDDNKIKSKVIDGNEVLEGKSYSPVKLLNRGDKLTSRDSEIKGVRDWYDNYLFSYGIQRIKNKLLPRAERRRKVFYINKLKFETELEDKATFPITLVPGLPSETQPVRGASSHGSE